MFKFRDRRGEASAEAWDFAEILLRGAREFGRFSRAYENLARGFRVCAFSLGRGARGGVGDSAGGDLHRLVHGRASCDVPGGREHGAEFSVRALDAGGEHAHPLQRHGVLSKYEGAGDLPLVLAHARDGHGGRTVERGLLPLVSASASLRPAGRVGTSGPDEARPGGPRPTGISRNAHSLSGVGFLGNPFAWRGRVFVVCRARLPSPGKRAHYTYRRPAPEGRFHRVTLSPCPKTLPSAKSSSSAPAPSSLGRAANSITPACRPARR